MRFTPKNRVRRTAAAGVIALAMLGTAGCSAVNEQATTIEYSPSDGIAENVADLQLRNILVVSNGFGEPGRLLGTVVNDSNQAQRFSLDFGGTPLSWTLPAGGKVVFEDEDEENVTVAEVQEEPGTGIDAELVLNDETKDLNIPVVNGDQADYRPYLPTGSEYTPRPVETTEAATSGEGH
ncbi:hypothetical protein [Arthrobacter sp. zg-Y179]|uniref:hypothetical protein n=1 Tax=Arthrobacter sp. zg-Y179 TaxID=2894188 RepID=UPI001E2CC274|nr:hypothetical protein [Arthrobacter sp. zg-Y179]MCC9175652.1 hypothetical protein [Arthrobacter sp. zg-Y179]